MKYQDEIESVRQQAQRMHEDPSTSLSPPMLSWAEGVEDALIWAQGNGTSQRMKGLVHDAEARAEVVNSVDKRALAQANDLLGEQHDRENVNGEYARACLEMVIYLSGLNQDEGGEIVAGLLGVDYAELYRKP